MSTQEDQDDTSSDEDDEELEVLRKLYHELLSNYLFSQKLTNTYEKISKNYQKII